MNEQRIHVDDMLLGFYSTLQNTNITVKTQTTYYRIISLSDNRKNVFDIFLQDVIIYFVSDKCINYNAT